MLIIINLKFFYCVFKKIFIKLRMLLTVKYGVFIDAKDKIS